MKNSTPDGYKDADLGSFCQKKAESELSSPPTTPSEVGPRLPPTFRDNQEAKPPAVPLQPPSASDEQEVLAVKQKTIEQIVLDVWDKNKELFITKGAGFRKDFTIKVLERLVPPEFRKNLNYETIESVLPFLCCFEDPNRVLRAMVERGRITLPKKLLEKRARTEKLYHDYYSPTNEQDNPDENNDTEGKGDVS
jgi:hypothetical protein